MIGNSCICEGQVWHRRTDPLHEFRYRIFMLLLDLDELPELFQTCWLWSARYPNIAWFRRADHFGPRHEPLAESVRRLVENETGTRPTGAIRLLSQLRYFGFMINPICIYYCYDLDGNLEFVVAEVTNTPWREKHCYVLDVRQPIRTTMAPGDSATAMNLPDPSSDPAMIQEFPVKKMLHVSPFMDMNHDHAFTMNIPAAELVVRIENFRQKDRKRLFEATLQLHRTPMSHFNLARVLCRYPLMTVQIWIAIYWQALRLWLKGARFYRHPKRAEDLNAQVSERLQGSHRRSSDVCIGTEEIHSMYDFHPDDQSGSRQGAASAEKMDAEKDLENATG